MAKSGPGEGCILLIDDSASVREVLRVVPHRGVAAWPFASSGVSWVAHEVGIMLGADFVHILAHRGLWWR